jgi:formylmethanofuran dehydrogenase subunit D
MNLTPEQKARLDIDAALVAAAWVLQNREASNLAAGRGNYSQHNIVVYKEGDQYRGMPHSNTILMNRADIDRAGFRAHQRVTVQGEAGELQNVEIISGEIRSGTPAFKRVPVLVRAGRGAVAAEVAGSLSSEYHTLHHS